MTMPSALLPSRSGHLLVGIAAIVIATSGAGCDLDPPQVVVPQATLPVAAPSQVVLLDKTPFRETYRAMRDADGSLLVMTRGHRARLHGSDLKMADADAASDLIAAKQDDAGWTFVALDGAIFHAPSFLGPLTRLPDLPHAPQRVSSHGPLMVLDYGGDLWRVDPSGPSRVTIPGRVLGMDFLPNGHGAAALEGGALVQSADAGKTWTPVSLSADAAYDVSRRAHSLVVALASKYKTLTEDGKLSEALEGTDDDQDPRPTQEQRRALDAAVLQHDAAHLDGETTADGTTFALAFAAGSIFGQVPPDVVAAGPHGVSRRASGEVWPATLHKLASWGPSLAGFAMPAQSGPLQIVRSRAGAPFESYGNGPQSESAAIFSDDGEHVAWPGACAAAPATTVTKVGPDAIQGTFNVTLGAQSDLCVASAPRVAPVTVHLSPAADRIWALHGDQILYTSAKQDLYIASVAHPTGTSVALPATFSRRAGDLLSASFGSDGTLAVSWKSGARVEAAVGSPNVQLQVMTIPSGASAVAFAGARQGMASGLTAADIWRTVDGGDTWSRVPSPVDGDARSVPVEPWIKCGEYGCTVGKTVRVLGWGPFVASPSLPSLPFARKTAAPPEPAPTELPPLTQMVCTATGATTAAPLATGSSVASRTETVAADGTLAVVHHESAAGDPHWSIAWTGTDADGTYQAAMPSTALGFADLDSTRLILRGATRKGLLLARCSTADGFVGACSVVYAEAAGRLHFLPFGEAANVGVSDSENFNYLGARPLHGGDLLVDMFVLNSDDERSDGFGSNAGPLVDHSFRIGEKGAISAERDFAWSTDVVVTKAEKPGDSNFTLLRPRLRGVASYHSVDGLAVATRSDAPQMQFYALGTNMAATAEAAPDVRLSNLKICIDPPDSAAMRLWLPSTDRLQLMVDPGDRITRSGTYTELEAGARGTCIRGIVSSILSPGDSLVDRLNGDGVDVHADHGKLIGTKTNADGVTGLTCAAPVPYTFF